MKFLRTTIIGGLIFLVPVVVVIFVVGKALQVSNVVAAPLAGLVPLDTVAGVAVANLIAIAIVVLICFLAGLLARSSIASDFVRRSETRFLMQLPGYSLLKGIVESLSGSEAAASVRPVLMKLDDASQVAFEVERLADGRVVAYVPDPKAGSVLIVEPERIEPLPIGMMTAMQNLRMAGKGTRAFLGIRKESSR